MAAPAMKWCRVIGLVTRSRSDVCGGQAGSPASYDEAASNEPGPSGRTPVGLPRCEQRDVRGDVGYGEVDRVDRFADAGGGHAVDLA